jgi:hypothetical protein
MSSFSCRCGPVCCERVCVSADVMPSCPTSQTDQQSSDAYLTTKQPNARPQNTAQAQRLLRRHPGPALHPPGREGRRVGVLLRAGRLQRDAQEGPPRPGGRAGRRRLLPRQGPLAQTCCLRACRRGLVATSSEAAGALCRQPAHLTLDPHRTESIQARFHNEILPGTSPLWEMPVFAWHNGYLTTSYNANLNKQCEER